MRGKVAPVSVIDGGHIAGFDAECSCLIRQLSDRELRHHVDQGDHIGGAFCAAQSGCFDISHELVAALEQRVAPGIQQHVPAIILGDVRFKRHIDQCCPDILCGRIDQAVYRAAKPGIKKCAAAKRDVVSHMHVAVGLVCKSARQQRRAGEPVIDVQLDLDMSGFIVYPRVDHLPRNEELGTGFRGDLHDRLLPCCRVACRDRVTRSGGQETIARRDAAGKRRGQAVVDVINIVHLYDIGNIKLGKHDFPFRRLADRDHHRRWLRRCCKCFAGRGCRWFYRTGFCHA